jgi:glycosyltransferase involved in cell wall biosynthesis
MASFHQDRYPGKPKILFVGIGSSSHTHSWIDLLEDAPFNVRLFSILGNPPPEWSTKSYLAAPVLTTQPAQMRQLITPYSDKLPRLLASAYFKLTNPQRWLAQVIQQWKPDIIHTLGLDPAAAFYWQIRKEIPQVSRAQWVIQIRGGSDLTLAHHDPSQVDRLRTILSAADQIISDNIINYDYLKVLGVSTAKIASVSPVPGTGGIDVEAIAARVQQPTSKSRVILWPKAYTTPWAVALPVMEAIQLAWEQIQPCEIYSFWTTDEVRMWYWSLPEAIRRAWHIYDKQPREETLRLIAQARVLLAPSLIDGVPNVLYEAMANKTFPIVSPIPTIRTVVSDPENVLFARNLYPEEIAQALIRAMSDDTLVDQAAERNLELVSKIANRSIIRSKVIEFYNGLLPS